MTMLKAILIYLLAINVVTFVVYGIDKYKAKHAKWRISEATLLLFAAIGGSIGAWCGMKVWHHKTMHKKFKYPFPQEETLAWVTYLEVTNADSQRLNIGRFKLV